MKHKYIPHLQANRPEVDLLIISQARAVFDE